MNSAEFLYIPHCASPNVNNSLNHSKIIKIRNDINLLLLTKLQTLFEFHQFSHYCPFLVSSSCPRLHITFVLRLLHANNSSGFPHFSPWQFWRVPTGKLFCTMSLRWACLMFSHDWNKVVYFLHFYYRNNVHFSVNHIKGFMKWICFVIGDINFYHLVKVVFTRFIYCKVILPSVLDKYLGAHFVRLWKLFLLQLLPTHLLFKFSSVRWAPKDLHLQCLTLLYKPLPRCTRVGMCGRSGHMPPPRLGYKRHWGFHLGYGFFVCSLSFSLLLGSYILRQVSCYVVSNPVERST